MHVAVSPPKQQTDPPWLEHVGDDALVIGMLAPEDTHCPICDLQLVTADVELRRCMVCHSYLGLWGETLQDIIIARELQQVYAYEINANSPDHHTPVDIYGKYTLRGHTYYIKMWNKDNG